MEAEGECLGRLLRSLPLLAPRLRGPVQRGQEGTLHLQPGLCVALWNAPDLGSGSPARDWRLWLSGPCLSGFCRQLAALVAPGGGVSTGELTAPGQQRYSRAALSGANHLMAEKCPFCLPWAV